MKKFFYPFLMVTLLIFLTCSCSSGKDTSLDDVLDSKKIVIGIDAKDSMVAIEGWEEVSSFKALDFAREMEKIGVKTIVYTDIATDGTLRGPNVEAMIEMSENLNLDVIASGGVGNEEHLIELSKTKVEGAIVGKALYTGNVELRSVLEKVK